MEKAFIEEVAKQDEGLILEFEQDLFGYRIERPASEANFKRSGAVAYNLPIKSMVGRSVKSSKEAVEHFHSNLLEQNRAAKRAAKAEVTEKM